jgi:hypothetical protein
MPTRNATDDRKPIPALPPLNWRHEVPKYRISRDTKPAPKERFKFEPPFSSSSESDVWQYSDRLYRASEVIETTFWPNPGTMTPLNYSARQVMEYFTSRQKSRLARTLARWPGFSRRRPDRRHAKNHCAAARAGPPAAAASLAGPLARARSRNGRQPRPLDFRLWGTAGSLPGAR